MEDGRRWVQLDDRQELDSVVEAWLCSFKNSADPPEDNDPVWQAKNQECIQLYENAREQRLEDLMNKGQPLRGRSWEDSGPEFWEERIIPFIRHQML